MATLREYFDSDFPRVMSAGGTLSPSSTASTQSAGMYEIPARVHYGFDSGVKYISYFVPSCPDSFAVCESLMTNLQCLLDSVEGLQVKAGYTARAYLIAWLFHGTKE
jgi:hypothetical protein